MTHRLIWSNFAHLFAVSIIPFSTGWIARSHLAAIPVALYAAEFVLVNATYIGLCWEVLYWPGCAEVPDQAKRMMRVRSFVTLAIFTLAAVIAFWWPIGGFSLICICLIFYIKPEAPRTKTHPHRRRPA